MLLCLLELETRLLDARERLERSYATSKDAVLPLDDPAKIGWRDWTRTSMGDFRGRYPAIR